jgi:uncharacterized protein (TIGR02391 family)
MASSLQRFERVVRAVARLVPPKEAVVKPALHPFEIRNIHQGLPPKVKRLFDDGHYADATFTAFKYLDKKVQKCSGIRDSGFALMMDAFNEAKPKLQLTPLKTLSEVDEQKGYRHVFAGSMSAIRNPRGHEFDVIDDPDTCLDHLSFVSMLLRRLEQAGFK